jgi:O-antigen ligase
MILAAALAAGRLAALAMAAGAGVKSDWRNRALWLSTREAAALMLSACALLTMLVSLVWTMSRSGIAGGVVAMLIVAVTAAAKMKGTARKVLVPLALAGLCAAGLAWKGADALASWYGTTDTLQWRFNQWRDTIAPLRDFWLTGSGLNTYGVLTLIYPQTDTTVHAAQAHNDYLQLAVEGGLLVGIPVLIAIAALIRTIVRRLRAPQDETTWWIRAGAVAGICGLAIQEVTEFSLQIPGIALLFTAVVAIAIHSPLSPTSRAVARVRDPR